MSRAISTEPMICCAPRTKAASELAVLPELFNTGYSLCPDFGPYSETPEGPTISHLRQRSRQWRMAIAAGFVERRGRHLYDSLAFCSPDGDVQIYRKRNLVFWERFRFHPGRSPLVVPTPWGRVGFAICADMIYRKVWNDYRDGSTWRSSPRPGPTSPIATRGASTGCSATSGPFRQRSPPRSLGPGHSGCLRQPMWRDPHDDPGSGYADQRPVRRSKQHLRRSSRCPGDRRQRSRPLVAPITVHPARYEIVAFYVPLGPRGVLFRLGTFLIGIWGGSSTASPVAAAVLPDCRIPKPLVEFPSSTDSQMQLRWQEFALFRE